MALERDLVQRVARDSGILLLARWLIKVQYPNPEPDFHSRAQRAG
jgi:hypothetical protein